MFCNACPECKAQRPAYCDSFYSINLHGRKDVFKAENQIDPIVGKFFGHSSFANYSIVEETSIVSARGVVKDLDELKLFASLGCGIQTGLGSILNLVQPTPEDIVMVCGLGGVGLSAIMVSSETLQYLNPILTNRSGRTHGGMQTHHRRRPTARAY